jgi:hypothetical protein
MDFKTTLHPLHKIRKKSYITVVLVILLLSLSVTPLCWSQISEIITYAQLAGLLRHRACRRFFLMGKMKDLFNPGPSHTTQKNGTDHITEFVRVHPEN